MNPIASVARCLLLEMQLKNVRYTEEMGFHVPEADGELGDWDIESQLRLLFMSSSTLLASHIQFPILLARSNNSKKS